MNEILEQSKNVLLALSHRKVFQAMEATLKEMGCETTDDFDADGDVDVVVMDSFYLKAGMADFIKMRNGNVATLLVLFEKERSEFQEQIADNIDDTLALGPYQTSEDLFFAMADWFKDKWASSFSNLLSQEFGNGLWVSMISRLGTIA